MITMGAKKTLILLALITILLSFTTIVKAAEPIIGCCCKDGEIFSASLPLGLEKSSNCDADFSSAITDNNGIIIDGSHYNSCEEFCRQSNGKTIIFIVRDENNTYAKGITIEVFNDNGLVTSGTTNDNGEFTTKLLEGAYIVKLKKYSCSSQESIRITENDEDPKKIELSINLDGCRDCSCLQWGECVEEDGKLIMHCLNIQGDCDDLTVPCITPEEDKCGNGVLDPGEQCEIINNEIESNINGCQGCNHCICTILNSCGNGVCDDGESYNTCPIDCKICNLNEEIHFNEDLIINHYVGEPKITISIPSISTSCEIKERLLVINTSGNKRKINNPRDSVDIDVLLDHYYTINYTVVLSDGHESKELSIAKTIFSGNHSCFEEPLKTNRKGCIDGKKAVCDNENVLILTPCENGRCIINNDNELTCSDPGICEKCNALTGNYAFIDPFIEIDGGRKSCSDLSFIGYCLKRNLFYGLFAYKSCSYVNSCYDYESEDSCISDSCNLGMDCEWVNSIDGRGVCRPKNEELVKCEECNNREDCDSALCSAYGDNCFYNGQTCLSPWNLTCRDYLNENDCIGGLNREVDTNWVNLYEINGDSTNHLTPSNDARKLGICVWHNDQCFRDADNYQLINNDGDNCVNRDCQTDIVPPETSFNIDGLTITNSRVILTMNELRNLDSRFNVRDERTRYAIQNNIGVGVLNTYVSFEGLGSMNFIPVSKLRENIDKIPIAKRYYTCGVTSNGGEENIDKNVKKQLHTGDYELRYFSMDKARNLEEVKSQEAYLDLDAPIITIINIEKDNYTINSNGRDIYLTNLKVNLSICEANPEVSCIYNLKRLRDGEEVTDYKKYGFLPDQVVEKFEALADGTYLLTINCSDKYGNSNEISKLLNIDADTRIYDPEPLLNITNSYQVRISVKSKYDGICRYSNETTLYREMKNTFEKIDKDDYKEYSATINTQKSGVYNYFVACNLTINDKPVIVENSPGDIIVFGVDHDAPTTTLEFDKTPREEKTIMVKCRDKEQYYNGYPLYSGCNETLYCIGSNCNDFEKINETEIYVNISMINDYDDYLSIYSIDNLGNKEEVKRVKLNISDLTPPRIIGIGVE